MKRRKKNLFEITIRKIGLQLEEATYVYDKTITTPMAYNVISFKDKKDAESFVSNYTGESSFV